MKTVKHCMHFLMCIYYYQNVTVNYLGIYFTHYFLYITVYIIMIIVI